MRLIDADSYKEYLDENWIPANYDAIDAQPTVDVLSSAEPKHGKWVEYVDDRWGASYYSCSECGEKPLKEERTNRRCLSNFCPNCGAKMEAEHDD